MSVLYDDVQMDQWTARNGKSFEICAVTNHFQEIYDWISSFDKQSGLP